MNSKGREKQLWPNFNILSRHVAEEIEGKQQKFRIVGVPTEIRIEHFRIQVSGVTA
jgi:hypothetical protein